MADTDCLFCQIADGRAPAFTVFSDSEVVAFLDVRPVFLGHTLVVPRLHAETLTDLATADVGSFFAAVQRITAGVERGVDADGSFVAMNNRISQSVPHLHVHVVPRRKKDGLRGFFWPRSTYDDETQAQSTASAIARCIQ